MTPEEANSKLCPVAVMGRLKNINCVADECSVWVWTETKWDRDESKTVNVGGRCGFIHPESIGVHEE